MGALTTEESTIWGELQTGEAIKLVIGSMLMKLNSEEGIWLWFIRCKLARYFPKRVGKESHLIDISKMLNQSKQEITPADTRYDYEIHDSFPRLL